MNKAKSRSIAAVALLSLVTGTLLGSWPGPAHAASSTAGDATPNFTESTTCGDAYGMRGPLSLNYTIGTRIYGPFADFFGRSSTQVSSSLSWWTHPNGSISFRVHDRALAAYQAAGQAIAGSGSGYRATTGSGWVWRHISGRRQLSHHAVGNAVDVNPPQNPYAETLITNMPPAYVSAWRSAGFCWGGDWRWSKDAMHYSWRGPAASGGQIPRDTPYPPLTPIAGFTQKVLDRVSALPAGADLYAMSDRRREGADDLYALVDKGSAWQIQVAGAVSDFGVVGVRRDTAATPSGIPHFADANGDGRADLWRFNSSGQITADIFFDADRFRSIGRHVVTGAAWTADAEIGLAVFDADDWLPDLYVIRRNSGSVEVYSSSSGYAALVHSSALPVPLGQDQVVLADRGNPTDGTADIWLVGNGPATPIRVIRFASGTGYSGNTENIISGMTVAPGEPVLPGDYDGDGRIDLYHVSGGSVEVWLGGVPDRAVAALDDWFKDDGPMTFDAGPLCSGDCDTIGYVDGSGSWRLAHETAWAPEETNIFYGIPSDEPFLGDWDCDGVDTPGLYRRSDGYVYLRNTNTQGFADIKYFFGIPGDLPIAGDFDGDGCDTVSIYRPSEARFYIINELGSNDGGLGNAEYSFLFGDHGDKPFAGDFDGDGVDTIGLHRESTGRVYMRNTNTTGVADLDFIYGIPNDFLLAGDWDGDGIDTPAIFRPSEGNWYVRMENQPGFADHVIPFGLGDRGFLPVAGMTALLDEGFGQLGACEVCYSPAEFDPMEGE